MLCFLELLTWDGEEYWFNGEPTCVAFSESAGSKCDASNFVCSSGTTSLSIQGSYLLEALRNENSMHPNCPRNLPVNFIEIPLFVNY